MNLKFHCHIEPSDSVTWNVKVTCDEIDLEEEFVIIAHDAQQAKRTVQKILTDIQNEINEA